MSNWGTAPSWTLSNSTGANTVTTTAYAQPPTTDYIEETVTYETAPDGTLIKKTTSRGVVRGEPQPVPDGSPWPPAAEDPYNYLPIDLATAAEGTLEDVMHLALEDDGVEDLEVYKERVRNHMRSALGALVRRTVHQLEVDAKRQAQLEKHAADVALMNAVNQQIRHFRTKAKTMLVETDETIELAPGVYKHAVQKILATCDLYDPEGKSL